MIGSNNVFEVGSTVLAKSVGDNNVFETKCELVGLVLWGELFNKMGFIGEEIDFLFSFFSGFVGEEIVVPSGCMFGAATRVGSTTHNNSSTTTSREDKEPGAESGEEIAETSLPENSVFYGVPWKHRIAGEKPAVCRIMD